MTKHLDMKEIVDSEPLFSRKIELVNPYLLKMLNTKIFNRSDRKDILQDTNLILISKQNEFNDQKSFWSWAFTILHFQILQYIKGKKRQSKREAFYFANSTPPSLSDINDDMTEPRLEWFISRKYALQQIRKQDLTLREKEFLDKLIKGTHKNEIILEMGLKNVSHYNVCKRRLTERVKKNYHKYIKL